jgi:integrase
MGTYMRSATFASEATIAAMSVKKRTYPSGKTVWYYVFDAPSSNRQNRRQIKGSGFSTKKEAQDAEAVRRVEVQEEYERRRIQVIDPEVELPKTLGSLLDRFFGEHGKKRLSAKALERYREESAKLDPALVATPLKEVTATRLSREWLRLLESGGRTRHEKKARPLSAKSVRNIAGIVSSAFTRGIEWGIVDVNPVEHSQPPKVRRKPKPVLSMEQTRLVIEVASSPWGLAIILELDAATGLRRGEILALRWSDVDLANGCLLVERSLSQTKAGLEFKETKSGNGLVPIFDTTS